MDRTAGEILIPVNGGEAYGLQGKVEICGVNTAKLKVLKNEETTELLKRTKQGDMAAREALIAGNLRLVLSVVQKMWTISFKWGVLVSSKPLIISTWTWMFDFPPTGYR